MPRKTNTKAPLATRLKVHTCNAISVISSAASVWASQPFLARMLENEYVGWAGSLVVGVIIYFSIDQLLNGKGVAKRSIAAVLTAAAMTASIATAYQQAQFITTEKAETKQEAQTEKAATKSANLRADLESQIADNKDQIKAYRKDNAELRAKAQHLQEQIDNGIRPNGNGARLTQTNNLIAANQTAIAKLINLNNQAREEQKDLNTPVSSSSQIKDEESAQGSAPINWIVLARVALYDFATLIFLWFAAQYRSINVVPAPKKGTTPKQEGTTPVKKGTTPKAEGTTKTTEEGTTPASTGRTKKADAQQQLQGLLNKLKAQSVPTKSNGDVTIASMTKAAKVGRKIAEKARDQAIENGWMHKTERGTYQYTTQKGETSDKAVVADLSERRRHRQQAAG